MADDNILNYLKLLGDKIAQHRRNAGYETPEAYATVKNLDIDSYTRLEQGLDTDAETFIKTVISFELSSKEFFGELDDLPKYLHLLSSSKN